MSRRSGLKTVCRSAGTVGLASAGLLHVVSTSGSPWPARTRRELADAVVGSPAMPGAVATLVVAGEALAAAVLVGGACGEDRRAVWGRRLIGAALISRAAVGGVAACRALGLPQPSSRFRSLDSRFYRPLIAWVDAGADQQLHPRSGSRLAMATTSGSTMFAGVGPALKNSSGKAR